MTLVNNEQRFKDARRAKLVDKDGKAVKKRKLESIGSAIKRRNEFLYSPDNLRKDRAIPGARDLMTDLMADGYLIAYVTSRPSQFNEATKNQLIEKNFPLFKDTMGADLLYSKGGSESSPKYKRRIVEKLNATYDVRMFFDDDEANLSAVGELGIPGLYSSISEYTRYRKPAKANPMAYSDVPLPGDPIGPRALPNPPMKPRRKKMKNGKYRKEPAKKFVDRFMGDPKMNKEFPDNGQRYAVCLHYVEEYYGKSGLKSVGAKMNPPAPFEEGTVLPIHTGNITGTKLGSAYTAVQVGRNIFKDIGEGIQDIYRGLIGGRQSMTEKRTMMAIAEMQSDLSQQALDKGGNALSNLKVDFEYPMYKGSSGMTVTLIAHADIVKTARKNPEEYSEDYMVPRDVHKLHMAGARIDDQYEEGEDVPEWWKSKLSVTADKADDLADALEYRVKSNPPKASKVEKAKKLYKHMNGQEVENVEKKKIDMGDVWYQVGEGGCWQIGYMSGKETGSSSQKYIHHFNEETQDGNYPKLYATMPESGKPMLVIMGGTWKIKTDDQGVAWIYD